MSISPSRATPDPSQNEPMREKRLGALPHTPSGHQRYHGEIEALRRHVAALEEERSVSNRVVNDLLARASSLERGSNDALRALAKERSRFRAHLETEIADVTDDNARLQARIAELQSSPLWAFARIVRALRARFRRP